MADNTTLPGTGDVIASDDVGGVKYQRVKPVWGVDGVAVDVEANNPLPTSVNASIFRFSTNNSTSAELASNATFTGVLETALDQPSISLLMTSDQPMTLTIFQYIDVAGVYAVTPIVYTVAASQGFSASFALNGNYVKVTAKNTGTATTTTFELNTAYGSLPASDGSGRLPTSQADCVPLLSQSLSAAGASTSIDSAGYASIVVQLSGVWQGMGYFETSNLGTTGTWSTTFVMATDSTSMQDVVTSDGVYTIIPGGRYLRFVLTSITGTAVLTAIGRSNVGVDPSAMLTLAMDKQNNTPLNVQVQGIKQDTDGAIALSDCAGPYYLTGGPTTNTITIDTKGFSWLSITNVNLPIGSGSASVHFANDISTTGSAGWAQGNAVIINQSTSNNQTPSVTHALTTGGAAWASAWPIFGRYAQVRVSAGATGAICIMLRSAPFTHIPSSLTVVSGNSNSLMGDVGQQYRANATGASTVSKFTAAASTNGALILTGSRRLVGWTLSNTTASAKFFRFYNKATAPTVGTDSPYFLIVIPANGTVTANQEGGVSFSLGLCISCTGAVADLDATVTAANDVIGSLFYS